MASSIIAILLALVFLEANSLNQCSNNKSNRCMCFHNEDYEFQCPPYDFNVLIHSIPHQELTIECHDLERFNMDLLPNYKAGDNTSVVYRFCPLPDDNFQPILNKFYIDSFSHLKLENVTISEASRTQNISKNLFYGLSHLKDLTLTNIYNNLDDDVLDFLPNLLSFELDHSDIDDVSNLKFPPSLKVLHLTGNVIEDVPIGLFRNLGKLYQLHLWGNNITRIRSGAFTGLKNLTSLELSSNSIKEIDEDSFADLEHLASINLRLNKLTKIAPAIFKYNKKLFKIRMEDNPNLILPDYLFADLKNLSFVNLKNSGIESLPGNVFNGSGSVGTILLQNNHLKSLPESIFDGLTMLEKLDLSRNELNSLPNNVFSSSTSLTELNLSFNNLSEITEDLFKNTEKLEYLMLQNNRIAFIEITSFKKLDRLISINLSNNLYRMDYNYGDPFNPCQNIKTILLRNNVIEEFPDFNVLLNLEEVDLSHNKIKELSVPLITSQPSQNLKFVNLSNNEIDFVNFERVELQIKYAESRQQVQVDLKYNPLICDCRNYDLVRYCQDAMDPEVKTKVNFQIEGTRCTQPEIFQHLQIAELKREHVSCEKHVDGCPKECKSFWKPYKNFYVFDCSNRNLTSFPRISEVKQQNIELNLNGNGIRGGLNSSLGYENVKHLFLSNNKLQELKWIPLGIEKLTLDRNELTHLDPELLQIMNKTSLKILKLSHNPWSCGCSALNLQIFIQDNYEKFQINSTDVICRDDNKPLVEKRELCKSPAGIILMSVLPILSFLILTVLSLIFYIYYRQEVKVWLFSKNLCLWFVSEEELDEDKIYDIFISYSHKDEDFVIQNLLPVLESGPQPFKTCIHVRDWEPGEMILTHVNNSISNSRRTLVVLSNNFLDSVWGIMEFKTAHMKALEEGRMRLVVVKYGDLDEKRLDNDLKAYLDTNTYIEWGKPWFWNKLKYALPHSRRKSFYKTNQKHANVMLKIDDKFELTAPPLKHPESTPPVITLDPSLLKKYPLHFNETNRSLEVPLVDT